MIAGPLYVNGRSTISFHETAASDRLWEAVQNSVRNYARRLSGVPQKPFFRDMLRTRTAKLYFYKERIGQALKARFLHQSCVERTEGTLKNAILQNLAPVTFQDLPEILFIAVHQFQDSGKPIPFRQHMAADLVNLPGIAPNQEIVFILKQPIESGAGDTAGCGNALH